MVCLVFGRQLVIMPRLAESDGEDIGRTGSSTPIKSGNFYDVDKGLHDPVRCLSPSFQVSLGYTNQPGDDARSQPDDRDVIKQYAQFHRRGNV
jgi:hypothetical protein